MSAAAAAVLVVFAAAACTASEDATGTSAPGAASSSAQVSTGTQAESSAAGPAATAPPSSESTVSGQTGSAPGSTKAGATSKPGGSGTGVPAKDPTASPAPPTSGSGAGQTDLAFPDQPAVVAAAKASVDQVVQLHALAVSAGHPDRIPGEVIPSTATKISDALSQQATMVLALAPAADSEQAKLADSLDGYRDLATQLAKWDPAAAKPLDKKFFAALAKNDKAWLAAMKALGKVTGEDLTEGMPDLLTPAS
jgi:hypothetical protein